MFQNGLDNICIHDSQSLRQFPRTAPAAIQKTPEAIVNDRKIGLDFLRCLAIAMVLLSHVGSLAAALWPGILFRGFLGFLGVEIFFVLSGFLIGGILFRQDAYLAGSRGLIAFYLRRWFRTLPNYYLFWLSTSWPTSILNTAFLLLSPM